jgi:hypothetical protein
MTYTYEDEKAASQAEDRAYRQWLRTRSDKDNAAYRKAVALSRKIERALEAQWEREHPTKKYQDRASAA